MAAPDSVVTDTHPLIFHAAGGGRLGPHATAIFNRCERGEATIYVPAIVMWECCLLVRINRIDLQRSVQTFFEDLFTNPSFQPLDLTPEQAFAADALRFTRDPFDALIVAAAKTIGVGLITRDAAIRESGSVRVWW